MKEDTILNFCWPFKLDEVYTCAYLESAFSKEECEKIIKIGKNKKLIKGRTSEDKSTKRLRKSKITWLSHMDDMDWVFRRCTDIINDLNNKFFKFDLYGFNEGFQFTNYKAPDGKYGRHVDRGTHIPVRKLSVSIQLTDPSEYEGGDLYLYDEDKGMLMNKSQGTLILFPSFVLHEVTPITKGERNSLVAWITGPNFK
jgi:PKHD-type hydroxylase